MNVGDLLVAIGVSGLVVSLLPGILRNFRLHRGWDLTSCIGTSAMAGVVTVGLLLLGGSLSVIAELAIAVEWAVMAWQSWKWKR